MGDTTSQNKPYLFISDEADAAWGDDVTSAMREKGYVRIAASTAERGEMISGPITAINSRFITVGDVIVNIDHIVTMRVITADEHNATQTPAWTLNA